MKILVLGLGISGQSAREFLEERGHTVVGIDDDLHREKIEDMSSFDLFVPSPGVAQTHPLYLKAKEYQIPIKGEMQLALEEVTQLCIGVTGTNGKSTVVKMIAHCLNQCGKKARAVGNIGEPLTRYVSHLDEILVVELSSYQLETVTAKSFDVGIILNIAEDHLDRYAFFEDYAKAKTHLQFCIKEKGKFFVHKSIPSTLFSTPCDLFSGQNEEAAFLVCARFGIDRPSFLHALSSFVKPEHRLEFVGKIDGVAYYNDSKATNVSAVIHALKTVDGSVVLIAGGRDKGLNFEPLGKLKTQLASVVVFGEAREKIANALKHRVDVHVMETLHDAVAMAKQLAKGKSTVLFSPGCASFDGFKNYAERGEAFKRLVRGEK